MFRLNFLIVCIFFTSYLQSQDSHQDTPLQNIKQRPHPNSITQAGNYEGDCSLGSQKTASLNKGEEQAALPQNAHLKDEQQSQKFKNSTAFIDVAIRCKDTINRNIANISQENTALNIGFIVREKLKKNQEKIRNFRNKTQEYPQLVFLTSNFEEGQLQEDKVLSFNEPLYNKQHESDGAVEGIINVSFDMYYTLSEPQDNVSTPDNQSEHKQDNTSMQNNQAEQGAESRQDDSSVHSTFNDHIKDAAITRDFDNQLEQQNQQNTNDSYDHKEKFSNDYQEKERSRVYTWCKDKKEKIIGPSQRTSAQRKKAQEKVQSQLTRKESSHQDSNNSPSDALSHQKNDVETDYDSDAHQNDERDDETEFLRYITRKIRREEKLLAMYKYEFQPSEELKNQLIKTSAELEYAHHAYNNTAFISYDYWFTHKVNDLYKQLEKADLNKSIVEAHIGAQKRAWRAQALHEIGIKEQERTAQENANIIKAEQEKSERLQKQVECLIAYGYKFELSARLKEQIQQIQMEFADAQNRSILEYWFTQKYAQQKKLQATLEALEAELIKEEASKTKILGEIAQKEMDIAFNNVKNAIVQDLTYQHEIKKLAASKQKHIEDIKKQASQKKHSATQIKKAQHEQKLKKTREAFENQKAKNLIEKQAVKNACQSIQDVVATVITRTGISTQDEAWQSVTMPSEYNACDAAPVANKNSSTTEQLLEAQYEWKQIHNVSQAHPQEQYMIHSMLDTIALAKNDGVIELAQASLRLWERAESARSEKERNYYIEKITKVYLTLEKQASVASIPQQAQHVQKKHIDNLLQDCTVALEKRHQKKSSELDNGDAAYFDRLEKRAQALSEAKEQLATKTLSHRTYEISPQAVGFMMAHNMNYTVFAAAHVTSFQHCLTQEILGIIESSADIAQTHDCKSIIGQLARYNCNLAISAQQLNQASRINEAVAITDLAHFFALYGKALMYDDLQTKLLIEVGVGVYEGSAHALQKWYEFGKDLCCAPKQTIGKLSEDLQTIGICLYKIAGRAYEFTSAAYLDDKARDMLDGLAAIKKRDGNASAADENQSSRTMQRTTRNAKCLQDGLYGAVQNAQLILDDMMQKTLRENVAGATEFTVNYLIVGKITDSLIHLSQLVGHQALQAADILNKNIPAYMKESSVSFIKNNGQLIAVADATGENVCAALAAAGNKVSDGLQHAAKAATQAKAASSKGNNGSKGGKDAPKKSQPKPVDNYTYEHGKYKPSAKHHKNSPDDIGKPPRDGQAALDNSFYVEKSRERVAVQDGNVVILKYEENKIYHGYIHEDVKGLTQKVKDALVENGYMKDATSKKIIKK